MSERGVCPGVQKAHSVVEDELPGLRAGTPLCSEVPGAAGGSEEGCEAFCLVVFCLFTETLGWES